MGSRKVQAERESANKCVGTDGKKSHLPATLSFFKIMIGAFSKTLFLPPKFGRSVAALADQHMYLEDIRGHQWRVRLSIVGGSLAFQQGWSEFVSDHSIKFGEFLVFNYIVGSHFLVKIFGTSGCERLDFSMINNNTHHKRKRGKQTEPSLECLPSLKAAYYMVDSDSMDQDGTSRSRENLSNASSFEMTESKCAAEDSDKVVQTLEKPSQDGGSSKKTCYNSEAPCSIVNKVNIREEEATRSRTTPCNSSELEMFGNTDKIPTLIKKSSDYTSCSKRTSHVSELPDYAIDEYSMNEVGTPRKKCNGEASCDAKNPEELQMASEKSFYMTNGVGSRHASFSLSDVEITETKCNAVDRKQMPITFGRFLLYRNSSKTSSDASEVPCCTNDGDLVNKDEATRSKATSCLSDFKMSENRCQAEDAGKIPESIKSSNCNSSKKGKLKMWMKYAIDKESVNEVGALRNNAAYSYFPECDKIGNKCNDAVKIGSVREKNPPNHGSSCKMSSYASEKACCIIDRGLDEGGDAGSPTGCSDKPNTEVIKMRCSAGDTGVLSTMEKSFCYENVSISSFDVLETPLIDRDPLNEECAPIQSQSNAEDVKLKMWTNDISHDNSMHEEGASRSRIVHSNSKSEMIPIKCKVKGIDNLPKMGEKPCKDSFYVDSNALQNLCNMVNEDLVNRGRATTSLTDPFSLPNIGTTKTRCITKDMDDLPRKLEKSSRCRSSSKGNSDALELPCGLIGVAMSGVNGRGSAPNSSDFNVAGTECSPKGVDQLQASKMMHAASELPCSVAEDMTNAEVAAMGRTAALNFSGVRTFDGECHSEDMDKEPKRAENPSKFHKRSKKLHACSMIGDSGYGNRNRKTLNVNVRRCPLSEQQKCAGSGNKLNSVFEEEINIGFCSKYELDDSKDKPVERFESTEFSQPGAVFFSCLISKSTQSRLDLPAYLPSALTKGRKRYERAVVFLRDPAMRVWPILYHERRSKRLFGSGWKSFVAANNLQEGDTCSFQVADETEALVQVDISRR